MIKTLLDAQTNGIEVNSIYNADCLDILKLIPDKSIDLILTDPPYLINYKTNRRKDKTHEFCSAIQNDSNVDIVPLYIKECFRVLKDDTAIYIFCSCDKVDIFKQQIEKYFKIKNIIIWVKNNGTAGDLQAQFGKQYEMIILANKGRKLFNGARITDVWNFDRIVGKNQKHQNEKPIDLLSQAICKHSQENDVVLDIFAGSGSLGVACKQTNRKYILIEKEEKYCRIIDNRINFNL